MPYAIGIDLGTTNSVVSIYSRGVPETVPIDGASTFPSVVSFLADDNVLVGRPAKSRLQLDPENTVASVKRSMGDRGKTFRVGNKTLTPVDISAIILKRLVEGAKTTLSGEIWDAVITVPAYFTEAQKEDTKRAGEEAGLNVLRLVPEPTAAAIAYGLGKGRDQTIMVYDLGGGTFDVSILTVKGNEFVVKAVGGDSHLGGDDFDQAIMDWACAKFKKAHGIDLAHDETRSGLIARQRLKEVAEAGKKELSQAEHALLEVPDCMGHTLQYELTLAEFNKLISPMLLRTVACMKATIKDAGMRPEDIDRVLLVGGSTKNKAVREIVAREIKDPYTSEHVDEVVAHGASIVAASLSLPEEDHGNLPDVITDVTAHSLGVDAAESRNAHRLVFVPIIPRQTQYPCRRGMLGATSGPRQPEVVMRVFRGEDEDPDKNTYLGELTLPVSPTHNDHVPIAAIFELDADGIIHFTAVQLPVGPKCNQIIQYAMDNDGALDLNAVDALVKSGDARAKTINVKTVR